MFVLKKNALSSDYEQMSILRVLTKTHFHDVCLGEAYVRTQVRVSPGDEKVPTTQDFTARVHHTGAGENRRL